MEAVVWIYLAQNSDQWRAVGLLYIPLPSDVRKFPPSGKMIYQFLFSGRTLSCQVFLTLSAFRVFTPCNTRHNAHKNWKILGKVTDQKHKTWVHQCHYQCAPLLMRQERETCCSHPPSFIIHLNYPYRGKYKVHLHFNTKKEDQCIISLEYIYIYIHIYSHTFI
jgi:hypothetical protein